MENIIAIREEVERFLSIQQTYNFNFGHNCGRGTVHGSDFGYGFNCGSGVYDGSGYGYGSIYGSGAGGGRGYGCGCPCGDGDSNGSGSGSAYGCGDGVGGGSGYGGGDIQALNGNIVDYVDSVPTIIIQIKGNFAKGYIIDEDNLTFVPCYIAKVGNSFAHGKTLKEAVADAKVKDIEKMAIEERIEKFKVVFGSLDSEHTGKKFYDWHHILTGSCRMGRDRFCKVHKIDLEKKYTVRYFLDITENAYGGDVIKQIRESYGLMVNGDMPGYVLNIPSLAEEEGMTQSRLSEKYTMRGIYPLKDGYCKTMGEPQEE